MKGAIRSGGRLGLAVTPCITLDDAVAVENVVLDRHHLISSRFVVVLSPPRPLVPAVQYTLGVEDIPGRTRKERIGQGR